MTPIAIASRPSATSPNQTVAGRCPEQRGQPHQREPAGEVLRWRRCRRFALGARRLPPPQGRGVDVREDECGAERVGHGDRFAEQDHAERVGEEDEQPQANGEPACQSERVERGHVERIAERHANDGGPDERPCGHRVDAREAPESATYGTSSASSASSASSRAPQTARTALTETASTREDEDAISVLAAAQMAAEPTPASTPRLISAPAAQGRGACG